MHALASGQTRVASYMLTKCQGLSRFPWLGYTAARHHDYTHADGKAPGATSRDGQRVMRDICRWHVEEFAYLANVLVAGHECQGARLRPKQAADAVKAFKPKIVYPYHYSDSDTAAFKELVGDAAEVRLVDWYAK